MTSTVDITTLPLAINVDPERERMLREAEKSLPLEYQAGWHDDIQPVFSTGKGLSREVVLTISKMKKEPEWMTQARLKAYDHFLERPMPSWGADLGQIDFEDIHYYLKPAEQQGKTWDDVPKDIKETFDKLGIPEAERSLSKVSLMSLDRKSTRLNSSHSQISYAVFCLKKKIKTLYYQT